MSLSRSYQETIDYLYGLQKHGIKLALSTSTRLMNCLGNPHLKFRSIHIAGTNGKGSTAAFLAQILHEEGYRVGLYTSPHLISFTERIRINGIPIDEATLIRLVGQIQDSCSSESSSGSESFQPTFFEVTTALAFTYFAEKQVDIAVVEVGMGGRLDATNVITPLVSIITTIALEHQEFLGETLKKIAREKAGIIKSGIPVVIGAVPPEAAKVLEQEAAARNAPVVRLYDAVQPLFPCPENRQLFTYNGRSCTYPMLRVTMLGRHQVENACLALAALECMQQAGIVVHEKAVRQGLERTLWEGRMERVSQTPDIYLDGAHNPAGAKRLAETLRDLKSSYQRIFLIIGVLKDKDYQGIISELLPLVDHVIATQLQNTRALDVEVLKTAIRTVHASVEATATVEDALERVRMLSDSRDMILITGSLYGVGNARALFVDSTIGAEVHLQ